MKKITFTIIVFLLGISNSKALSNEKYYKTTYENNVYKVKEISSKEYNSVDSNQLSDSYIETEYKKISLNILGNTVKLNVNWKKTPRYKSYDVIAIMGDGVTFDANSIVGYQIATLTNDHQTVHYDIATKNTKIFNNGIGISMNLIDTAIYYNLSLSIRYTGRGKVYGNYRHATSNVSLNQSLNYYLNNGSIIFNTDSLNNTYDNISPIFVNI